MVHELGGDAGVLEVLFDEFVVFFVLLLRGLGESGNGKQGERESGESHRKSIAWSLVNADYFASWGGQSWRKAYSSITWKEMAEAGGRAKANEPVRPRFA